MKLDLVIYASVSAQIDHCQSANTFTLPGYDSIILTNHTSVVQRYHYDHSLDKLDSYYGPMS